MVSIAHLNGLIEQETAVIVTFSADLGNKRKLTVHQLLQLGVGYWGAKSWGTQSPLAIIALF